jgi:crotonobetainyl-CoA:carnitine CoA-transferase CaiB-like acyl-CoA transferase
MNSFLDKTLVLDLADEQGSFCAKLLADLGATVIKVEGSAGDAARSLSPRSFFYNNTNKLSVTIDLKTREGIQAFRALTKRADVLVETFSPGSSLSVDLGPQRLRRLNPRLIHLSMTPIGRTGLTGTSVSDALPELPGCHPCYIASLFGAVAVLLRLMKRKITGQGSYLDLSIHEAVASMLEHSLGAPGLPSSRSRGKEFSMLRSHDGYVQIPILRSWDTLIELMASDEKAGDFLDKRWQDPGFREQNLKHIMQLVENWTRRFTRREILELGQAMRLPWASVDSIDEALENPQLQSRQFFYSFPPSGAIPSIAIPGIPFKSSKFPNEPPRPAPLLGEHTQAVLEEFGAGPLEAVSKLGIRSEGPVVDRPGRQAGNGIVDEMSAEGAAQHRVSRLQRSSEALNLSRPDGRAYSLTALRACLFRPPSFETALSQGGSSSVVKPRCPDEKILSGMRVIDLTRMISGPYATRIFADFGAEVIKIQSRQTAQGAEQVDTNFFSIWNRNKRSINLDLSLSAARDVFLELVAESDLVVENFSPRVMANWGLGYERLREVNPDLVMVSISAMGHTGPWRDFVGFAPTFHALSGLISAISDKRNPPADIGYPYADMVAGLYAALAALAALEYRDRTGKGQHIDLSALEAICAFESRFGAKDQSRSGLFDLTTDPRLIARRFIVQLQHPVLGKVLSARTPLWDWRRKPRWKASPLLEK